MKKYFLPFILSLFTFATAYSQEKMLQRMPLIPLPQNVAYKEGVFNLKKNNAVYFSNPALKDEAELVIKELSAKGIELKTAKKERSGIILKLNPQIIGNESYTIAANSTKITIEAVGEHGIFNGIQTLKQLIRADFTVEGCSISDSPAFQVRGYMIDVGRNYQSLPLIKKQIDVMAAYKMNVLHFHATEDIAWRFEIPGYPQLNSPEFMTRDKGKFYSVKEFKEIQDYCSARHITLIPEIDMPGHSAAFEKAMKAGMQTEKGMAYLKDIVEKFISIYKPEYLHIGGDEVKITNKNFLPEMIGFIHSKGVKTLGWAPGGNIGSETIRQLWKDDNGHKAQTSDQFIDSRHLYINHMDPLETVTTIFYRQIGDIDKGNEKILGGIICNWPDRKVEYEDDVLKKSAALPAIVAMAERSWRGGGIKGWKANIGSPGDTQVNDFKEFESRLMQHKTLYFKNLPFPYAKQQDVVWSLYGPFDNGGNTNQSFAPEDASKIKTLTPFSRQIGGTVILRHWWFPLIEGAIDQVAKENSTWYATTQIWSDESAVKNFWISFNNLSRSPATDSPPVGEWDEKNSRVWVNGTPIPPPAWKNGGKVGNSETPLTDEGYEYRIPTKIKLNKGWNTVLLKAPVASLKGKNWENPVKWMFTFVEAE